MGKWAAPIRRSAPVGYEIDRLIEPHPIFPLIQRHAQVDDTEMFEVFNMGLGFCYVVDPASADHTLAILKARSRPRTPPAVSYTHLTLPTILLV